MRCCFTRKIIYGAILLSLMSVQIMADAHISTQSHQSAVTMAACGKDGSFFTAGQDGFIIKWTEDGLGEHYQLTELEIRLIALHPNGTDIAVYETDGYSMHRVSVWNWNTLSRKFVKTFSNSITALSFTAKGTLLAVGTATVNGTVYLNPINGRTVAKLKDSTGIVNLIYSSATEKTSLMYSPAGHLSYYNMTTGTRKQRFQTEQQLEKVVLFNNNLFLAGIKNNQIYIIDTLTGATVARISASSPMLLNDSTDISLYYTEFDGRTHTLRSVVVQHTEQGASVGKPATIKKFTGPTAKNTLTCTAKTGEKLILGTRGGDVFTTDTSASATPVALFSITDNMYDKILDITVIGNDFYCLTPNTIFRTSYDTGVVETVGSNSGFTDMVNYEDNILLWSKGGRKSVVLMDIQTNTTTGLFTPKNYLQTLRLFGNKIIYIEGNSTVNLYDIETKKNSELYTGTGLQDAVLFNDTELFVAKSSASNPKSPLINVNTVTKETAMLPVNGNVAFSLSYTGGNSANAIYGIQVISSQDSSSTTIFAYNPFQKNTSSIMKVLEEDTDAFLTQYGTTLYTNIGKNQIRSYDIKNRRQIQLNRSASLPLKLVRTENRVAVLNRDGSISWYNVGNGKILADWYMTVDGMWFEF